MSTTVSSIILTVNNLTYDTMLFVRCYSFALIPIGFIGHLMSIYVFTRKTLRTNPCSRYFLAATIAGLLNTCYTLPIRTVQSGYFNLDPGAFSNFWCRFFGFFSYSIRGLSGWLIVLASADRYFCSCQSANKRAWNSLRVANRAIPVTTFFSLIVYIPVAIFLQVEIAPTTGMPFCNLVGPVGIYRTVLSYLSFIHFGLLPSFFMLLFGILTIRNLNRSKRLAVAPAINDNKANNSNNRRINRNLFQMLLIQVLVYCTTGLTFSAAMIYLSVTGSMPKPIIQQAQEKMMSVVVGMLSNTGPCTSFYLFTLSSGLFRKELKNLFCFWKKNDDRSKQSRTKTANKARPQAIPTIQS